jgi:hypothetical protein
VIERNASFTDTFVAAANADQSFLAYEQLRKNGVMNLSKEAFV